jgi:hypothetical protein
MAAFYPDMRRIFYRRWVQRAIVLGLDAAIGVEGEQVVHRMSEILLASQVTLGRLHRGVPEQELNLLQLTTAAVAQLRTSSPQVCGAICSKPALSQQVLTTYHTTFCEMPFPHTFPILATARNILPSVIRLLVSTDRALL